MRREVVDLVGQAKGLSPIATVQVRQKCEFGAGVMPVHCARGSNFIQGEKLPRSDGTQVSQAAQNESPARASYNEV